MSNNAPWRIGERKHGQSGWIFGADGTAIVQSIELDLIPLIAAAPDLLEALEDAIKNVKAHEKRTGHIQFMPWIDQAYKVIAKAKGES